MGLDQLNERIFADWKREWPSSLQDPFGFTGFKRDGNLLRVQILEPEMKYTQVIVFNGFSDGELFGAPYGKAFLVAAKALADVLDEVQKKYITQSFNTRKEDSPV